MSESLSLHSFSIPVDSVTLSKAGSEEDGEWSIEGLASTNSLDYQNEVVLVKGLDLSYLESGRGTFNWNHRGDSDPSSVVGVITESRRTPNNELFIKGKLLKSLPKAKHVFQLLKALQSDCPERKMGMSIEGKVLARNGNQIVKAWVKAVALTLDPVNKDTWVSFAKSLDGYEWAPEDITIDEIERVEKGYNMPQVNQTLPVSHSVLHDSTDIRSTRHTPAFRVASESSYGDINCEHCGVSGIYKNFSKVPSDKSWRNNDLVCANCAHKHLQVQSVAKALAGQCPHCKGPVNIEGSALVDTPYCHTCGDGLGEGVKTHVLIDHDEVIKGQKAGYVVCSNCKDSHDHSGWEGVTRRAETKLQTSHESNSAGLNITAKKSLESCPHCMSAKSYPHNETHNWTSGTCDNCGKEGLDVHENDYGEVHCKGCHENDRINQSERAEEDSFHAHHSGSGPATMDERHKAAYAEKMESQGLVKGLVATLNPNHLHSDNPLLPESLDSRLHDLGYAGGGRHSFSAKKRKKRKKKGTSGEKINKSYSYHEAIARLRGLSPILSEALATKIVDFTLQRLGEE